MRKTITRILATAMLVIAAAAPATASARINLSGTGSERGESVVIPSPQATPSSSSSAFSWGDAAIGAGVTLLIVGVGGTAGVAGRRRRVGRTAAA